jgi:hypothetical protein
MKPTAIKRAEAAEKPNSQCGNCRRTKKLENN